MSLEQYSYQQPATTAVPANGWAPVPAPQPQAARPPTQLEKLGEWAQAAQAAYSVAEKLVGTSFVPAQFKGKAHEATAAILAGSEVGLSPMAALRSFDIIQGVAAPRALTLRAVVQAAGHDIWVAEATETRAIVRGRRKGSDKVQESVWTVDRARGLGLLGKDNWKKQQGAMLVARASSECCRLIASDAILGLPYAAEELYDEDPAPLRAEQVAPAQGGAQAAARTTRRRTPPAQKPVANTRPPAADQPAIDGPPLPEDGPGDAEAQEDLFGVAPGEQSDSDGRMTNAQQKKLFALLRENDIEGEERKTWASGLLGRAITSYGQLTVAEANKLIDTLESLGTTSPADVTEEPPF